MPSSRGSSLPRDRIGVSCIAGGFFTSWATREAPYCSEPSVTSYRSQRKAIRLISAYYPSLLLRWSPGGPGGGYMIPVYHSQEQFSIKKLYLFCLEHRPANAFQLCLLNVFPSLSFFLSFPVWVLPIWGCPIDFWRPSQTAERIWEAPLGVGSSLGPQEPCPCDPWWTSSSSFALDLSEYWVIGLFSCTFSSMQGGWVVS